jgi:hypothetical protein
MRSILCAALPALTAPTAGTEEPLNTGNYLVNLALAYKSLLNTWFCKR